MVEKVVREFLMLWTTIDPIGTLAIFAAVTAGVAPEGRRKIALRATLYAAMILVGSILVGQFLLEGLGIRLSSLQVAGGIILFLFGLQMIFGTVAGGDDSKPEAGHDLAVFPLAVPSLASPGAIMAVILLTNNELYTVGEQAVTTALLVVVLGVAYVLMLTAERIVRILGNGGVAILTRVMGMILASLSVELVLEGLGIQPLVEQVVS